MFLSHVTDCSFGDLGEGLKNTDAGSGDGFIIYRVQLGIKILLQFLYRQSRDRGVAKIPFVVLQDDRHIFQHAIVFFKVTAQIFESFDVSFPV